MAIRNPLKVEPVLYPCTEFVLHKSQQPECANIQKKIIDYTEHRLLRYAEKTSDAQQRLTVMALLVDYRKGNVAIAWRAGSPTFVRITKDC
jgi:hypothetical protein